jgi:dihydroneopterin aldolase
MKRTAKVVVSGLRAFAYHGCMPQEREQGQVFLVDIELEYDADAAVREDELSRAVDYDVLAGEVHAIVTGERHDLIETLAARIGEHVMRSTPALSVLVRVRKPQAPMRCEVGEVAVEMSFRRDERS